jgi:hypothetical protein
MTLPYAIFASGAVMRVFHPTYREARDHDASDPFATVDILRRKDETEQWSTGAPGLVALSGGIHASDVLPAYDEDAKFYFAPAPFTACGGVLAALDADASPEGLADLARLWLVPGQHGTGVLVLRSGERIELPWRAATLLFGVKPAVLPESLRNTSLYAIDVSELTGASLVAVLSSRLTDTDHFPPNVMETLGAVLERSCRSTRAAAAALARHLRDRMMYEGAAFRLTEDVLRDAVTFAVASAGQQERRDARAA